MENKDKKNHSTVQRIMAITTITTMAAAGMSHAQTATVTEVNKGIFDQAMSLFRSGKPADAKQLLSQNGIKPMHGKGHHKGKMADRKEIEAAIIAGNFANFQVVASSSPLANIDQSTFNLLTPQFTARRNAEDQIRNILTAAGIQVPTPGQKHSK